MTTPARLQGLIEPIVTGTYEYWFNPEISVRGLLGFTQFDAGDAEADLIIMNGNIVYSWGHQTLRPYVDGGLGFYNGTWDSFGGREFAAKAGQATREQQIVVANRVAKQVGLSGWGCLSHVGKP